MIAVLRVQFGRAGLREAMRRQVREAAARRLDAMEGAPASDFEEWDALPDERVPDFLTKT
ncbi:hypothetical protein [Aureimonas sp. AU12]|uniref:hypothetical protein n=1 Tax=Aureimonas sp. AU12 TaxID=1638161 RepID=UPI00078095D8|nr:hypothetical protein [Aureimonas sp. AU12]